MAVFLNTLKYARALRDAGVKAEDAEKQAEALAEALETAEVATKADLRETERALRSDMKELEYRLTLRIFASQIAGTVGTAALVLAVLRFVGKL